MMDCPKCGFSQPKDQFCANCGLNLEQFKPAPRPFYEVWAANPYVIATCCVLIVATAFYYLKMKSPTDLSTSSQTITRDETFTEEQRASRERELAERRQRREAMQSAAAQRAGDYADPTDETLAPVAPSAASAEADTATLTATQSGLGSKKLQVRFFEINQRDLSTLFAQGKVLSETNQYRTLAIEKYSSIEGLLKNSKTIPGTKTFTPVAGKTGEIFYENAEKRSGAAWEFNLSLAFTQIKDDAVIYQMGGDFFYATADKPAAPLEMTTETHTLKSDGAIAVAGWLPHNVTGEPALFENAEGPMKILGSPEFRESATEFLILIQLK